MNRSVLLALVFLLPAVAAQGDPSDYGDYQDYNEGDYNTSGGCVDGVEFEGENPRRVFWEYYYVCDGTVNVAEFMFEVGESPGFMLEAAVVNGYQDGSNGQPSGNVAAMEIFVDILGVAVFEDTDGDGAFGPDDEPLAQEDFNEDDWSSLRSSQQNGGIDFDATYDLSMGGTFKVVGSAQVAPYTVAGIRVQPGDTKIDFEFHDVPFPTETAKIALVLGITSEVATVESGKAHGIQGREDGIAIGGEQSAYFAWAKTVNVDGRDLPVASYEELQSEGASASGGGSSVRESEVNGVISLAYPQGKDIVHDPRLGVAFSKSGSNGIPGPGLIVAPLLLAAAALRRR